MRNAHPHVRLRRSSLDCCQILDFLTAPSNLGLNSDISSRLSGSDSQLSADRELFPASKVNLEIYFPSSLGVYKHKKRSFKILHASVGGLRSMALLVM